MNSQIPIVITKNMATRQNTTTAIPNLLGHALLLALFVLGGSTSLFGQSESRLQVAIYPKIGYYLANAELGSAGAEAADPIDTEATSKIAYGAAIEIRRTGSFVGLRISGDMASDVPIERDGVRTGGTLDIKAASVGVLVRTYGERLSSLFNLYMWAGAGLKKYDFTEGNAAVPQLSGRKTNVTLHFGAGVLTPIGPVALGVEGGVYPSWFDAEDPEISTGSGQIQTDFFVQAGLRIPLF